MSNKVLYFATFVAGAVVGGITTWQYTKKKYEQIAQEEIDSVKEVFKTINEEKRSIRDWSEYEDDGEEDDENEEQHRANVTSYKNLLVSNGYSNPSPSTQIPVDRAYVIKPDEFGEFEDYETISLFYTEDGVLLDDRYERVDDPDFTISMESLDHIGDYEDGCVHVRNDRLKADYEILVEERTYSEILRKELHREE